MENISKQQKSILINIKQQTEALTRKDIATWHRAWQQAINVDEPSRLALYATYTQSLMDLHLSGCILQRKNFVKKKTFRMCNIKTGDENAELTELLEAEWFKKFMDMSLDSIYWGHSLIQLGDVINTDKMRFSDIKLVPRQHVVPEYGVVVRNIGDSWKTGIDYRNTEFAKYCIEVGDAYNLGLLLKTTPHSLSKKNMLAYWDTFGEVFGMPIRIAKTMSRDQAEINKVENYLKEMGTLSYGLFPEGTEIEIKETARGDAFNVYDKRIDRANSEISKAILNQTMTIDSGSSYAQSAVHLEVFKNLIDADADMLRDVVNDKLLPLMAMHGFKVEGHRFNWDESVDYTPEQQLQIEQLMLANFEIDDKLASYFAEKYNIPVSKAKTFASFPQLKDKEDIDFFA